MTMCVRQANLSMLRAWSNDHISLLFVEKNVSHAQDGENLHHNEKWALNAFFELWKKYFPYFFYHIKVLERGGSIVI